MDQTHSTFGDSASEQSLSAWGSPLEAVVCERCDWSYLVPSGSSSQHCPHCFATALSPLSGQADELPYIRPPEFLLPFSVPISTLGTRLQQFAQGIPFSPYDLTPYKLRLRLSRLYLPMWLVDVHVQATWQAEAGFNYQVVSYQDRYDENRGGWRSQEVRENRIRWEARLGRLKRSYTNIAAPALEEELAIQRALGQFDLSEATPYQPDQISGTFIRLPNRTPQDVWNEAELALQSVAAEECRQAANADHMRKFSWQPEFHNQNWTFLLLPVYSTYYLDDENKPQVIFIHGRTGQVNGSRRSSMKRAKRASLSIFLAALLVFFISLLISAISTILPALLAIGVFGITLALLIALGALYPIVAVWWFNRK